MLGLINQTSTEFKNFKIQKLHPTFGAQISGVDFCSPISDEIFNEIRAAITKYVVLVFRRTSLNDRAHIEFVRKFGELDDVKPYLAAGRKNRLAYDELFDVSNVELEGGLVDPQSARARRTRFGNGLFHVDSLFNPRRAGYSLLLAHELPPPGTGGCTAFADTRSAFDDLSSSLKEELSREDYIADHSWCHSRTLAAPEFFAHVNPVDYPMGRHRLVQLHEPSERINLYIAAHAHHIEDMDFEKSRKMLHQLYEHAKQPKYVFEVEWENVGDLVIWTTLV